MRFSPVIVGVLVALVLTVAFWFLLYKPASEREAAVQAETMTLQDQQAALRNEISQLQDVKAREPEIRAAQARLDEYIPVGASQPSAIRQFQRAADQANAEIASVTFGEPAVPTPADGATPPETGTPDTTLANIPVTMVVEGGYFQVVDFFRRLEVEVPRAVLVNSVDISEDSDVGFPRLATTWTGQIFAVMDPDDIPTTDGAGGGVAPSPTPSPGASPTPAAGGGS